MGKPKDGNIDLKIEFEGIPIINKVCKNVHDFEETYELVRRKLR